MAVPDQVLVKTDWSGVESCPAHHINQIIAQVGPPSAQGVPDGVYLAFGSVSPPVFVGDEEQRAARVAELQGSTLKVDVHARIHVSRELLGDMIRVLTTAVEQYDAVLAWRTPQGQVGDH